MAVKDNVIVAVINDLTERQARKIRKALVKSKFIYAPFGRGRIASGSKNLIGELIQKGWKSIGG